MDKYFVGACKTLKGKSVRAIVQSIDGFSLNITFDDGTVLTLFEPNELARITVPGVPMYIWQTKANGANRDAANRAKELERMRQTELDIPKAEEVAEQYMEEQDD